jgi:hypothetical protein
MSTKFKVLLGAALVYAMVLVNSALAVAITVILAYK